MNGLKPFDNPVMRVFAIPYALNRCRFAKKNRVSGCPGITRPVLSILLLISSILLFKPAFAQETGPLNPPEFTIPSENLVRAGYLRVSWQISLSDNVPNELHFALQQARTADFSNARTVYRGADLASYRSGLPDGQFFYRVKTIDPVSGAESLWSETVVVMVQHHSLTLAYWLFALGAIVFLATVAVVWHGTRTTETI